MPAGFENDPFLTRALCVLAFGLAGCSDTSSARPSSPDAGITASGGASSVGGGADAAADASEGLPPVITSDVRAKLAALALSEVPPPPPDVTNRYADDPVAARLGQRLFYDGAFSGRLLDGDNDGSSHALGRKGDTGKVACSGCHVARDGFVDTRTVNHQISLGAGWVLRRAPSLLDVSRSRLLTWIGRRDTLYNQPFAPMESAVEMNSSRLFAAEQMFALYREDYEAVFGPMPPLDDTTRFPRLTPETTGCDTLKTLDGKPDCDGVVHGKPGDGAEYDGMAASDQDAVTRVVVNMGKALGAYERLLTCGTSRFDAWMNGKEDALSPAEQRGAVLFVTKGACVSCHSGPFFSDEKFHNTGLRPAKVATVFTDEGDDGARTGLTDLLTDPLNSRGEYSDGYDGRLPAAVGDSDTGAFRTPRLRCVTKRPSFMHTGQFLSLDETVAFFDRGGDAAGYPGTNELGTLGLTLAERADLVRFLQSLDGPGPEDGLLGPP